MFLPPMGSQKHVGRATQVRDSCSGYSIRRGCSKAQMCLQKILCVILSVPRDESFPNPQFGGLGPEGKVDDEGFSFDSNLRMGPSLVEDEKSEASAGKEGSVDVCGETGKIEELAAVSGGGSATEKSSEGECEIGNSGDSSSVSVEAETGGGGESKSASDKVLELSELTSLQLQSCEKESNAVEDESKIAADGIASTASLGGVQSKSNDCLSLLIKAAKLISGDFGDDSESDSKKPGSPNLESQRTTEAKTEQDDSNDSRSKRKRDSSPEKSPVVRSNRGRSQALPCRYKDSVLEPWRRQRFPSKISKKQRRRSR